MLLLFIVLFIELYLFAGVLVFRKIGFSFTLHIVERQGPLSTREYLLVIALWPVFLVWLVVTTAWEDWNANKN